MVRAMIIFGLVVIIAAVGAVGYHFYLLNAEAINLICLGDQHYREGRYLKALEIYQQSSVVKASTTAQNRIRLAQDALRTQQPSQPSSVALAVTPPPGSKTPPPTAVADLRTQPTGVEEVDPRRTARGVRMLLRAEGFAQVQVVMSRLLEDKRLTRSGDLFADSVLRHSVIDQDIWHYVADLLPSLDQWVSQGPSSSMARTFRGGYHYGAALQARKEGWAPSVTERGWALMREHLALAQRDLEAAYTLDPANPLPSSLMTSIARLTGADLQSLDLHFRRALQYDPTFYTPYSAKLNYLMPKWSGTEAAMFAFARESMAQAPRGSAIPFLLSEAHSEKGQHLVKDDRHYLGTPEVWLEIQNVHRRLMEDFPRSGNWPTEYALLVRRAGQLEIAGQYHDLALERDPEEFSVRYERGRFFEEVLGDLHRALSEYAEANRIERWSRKVLYRQGGVLSQTKQWHQAISTYGMLVGMDPENPQAYYQRAGSLFNLEQYQQAEKDYSRAIALKPDYKSAYQCRAACYERLGMPDKQQADLRTLKSLSQ